MDISNKIIKDFAKQVSPKTETSKTTTMVGTVIKKKQGQVFVELDGSNGNLTPVSTVINITDDDILNNPRVLVSLQNREATIIGNYTDPVSSGNDGTTYIPHVDNAGNISWTNDGDKPNPETKNIMGPSGEDATVLRIDSSRGTVFKNSQVSTILSVAIYRGPIRITTERDMKEEFGNGAYIQWYSKMMDEEYFHIISRSDSRLSDGGFSFVLSPDDVDTKCVFMCNLII